MSRYRSPTNAGFLMAETLITFALSALVLLGLVSAAAVLLRATDRSVASIGTADDLGRTMAALRRDLSGLKRARWDGEEPQRFVFKGGPNSLSFAQEMPSADGGRDLRVVSLREIEHDGGTALTRAEAHLATVATGWDSLRFGPARAVPTGVARLRFHYLAESSKDAPIPRPVDTWPSADTVPAAIIVEAIDSATTKLLVTDRIAVRADADTGCADRTPPNREGLASGPAAPGGAGALSPADGRAPQMPPQQQNDLSPNLPQPLPGMPGAPGAPFEVTMDVANKNEFCGRADKGVAARKNPPVPQTSPLPNSPGTPFTGAPT